MELKELLALDPEAMLTTKQVAIITGIPVPTIHRWRTDGRVNLPWVRIGPVAVRYRKADVMALLDAGRQGR